MQAQPSPFQIVSVNVDTTTFRGCSVILKGSKGHELVVLSYSLIETDAPRLARILRGDMPDLILTLNPKEPEPEPQAEAQVEVLKEKEEAAEEEKK